ncbi:hypothetical protein L1887_13213 [Cichorium endivia]|nr:hypothetical protein L1887_13213 [Cichorium endivia]
MQRQNSSNPYHECRKHCFKVIDEDKKLAIAPLVQTEVPNDEKSNPDDHPSGNDIGNNALEDQPGVDFTKLSGKQKKLFELRLNVQSKCHGGRKEKNGRSTVHKSREEFLNISGFRKGRKRLENLLMQMVWI